MTRPLVVSADADALDDLLRLTALAGVDAEVAHDVIAARALWAAAPLVVVAQDLLDDLADARLPRRHGVVVMGRDLEDPTVWQRGMRLGAEHVVFLPEAERWLVEALADASEGQGARAPLVAVIGGRGGAGATTVACSLAATAASRQASTLLLDADPLGGGLDVVFGAEHSPGLRWPDLVSTRGRVPAAALAKSLPRVSDISLLSWDRGAPIAVPVDAVQAVLGAARRSHDLVVADLARHLDHVGVEVLSQATTTLLVVPLEVRAAAAAGRVAARVALHCADTRLVVRGPSPAGLTADQVQQALALPLAGELRAEPGLARAYDEGEPPGARRGSRLGALSNALLDDLLAPRLGRAA